MFIRLLIQASGVSSMGSVSLASRRGHFSTLDELTACIRASMLVPGLAGPPRPVSWGKSCLQQQRRLPLEAHVSGKVEPPREESWGKGVWSQGRCLESLFERSEEGPDRKKADASEPLVDAMVYEPLPYRYIHNKYCVPLVGIIDAKYFVETPMLRLPWPCNALFR